MLWRLILKYFGPNIQNINGFEIIVADTISRFPYESVNKYKTSTSEAQCCRNKLFTTGRVDKNEDCFPLNIWNMQREQQK